MRLLVALCCAVLWSTAAMAGDVASQFDSFCLEWMGKLAARQEHNMAHIKWDTKPDGVKGEYVGYTTEHTCTLKNETQVPIGKIVYREIVFQKSGGTISEAEKSTAQAIETTEVTEIFRYAAGKWVY
jgi:hypothetical protein